MSDKNHTTIPKDAEKAFDKIQHPVIIKTFNKLSIEEMHLNTIKAIYGKPHSQHHSQWLKAESFFSKITNETRMLTLFTLTECRTGSPSQRSKAGKIKSPKEKRKKSLFSAGLIFTEKILRTLPKNSTANQ